MGETRCPPTPQEETPGTGPGAATSSSSSSTLSLPPLPPLPAAFHDLYASTVRTTTRDDPSLHQGRTRQTPHVAGLWPSHVYVEWHPPPDVHALLARLVAALQQRQITNASAERGRKERKITSLLLSDLGAPLPLHISLSRPLALASDAKAPFLRDTERAVRASGVAAFRLACRGAVAAEWHRTAESGRSFLVLRVRSSRGGSESRSSIQSGGGRQRNVAEGEQEDGGVDPDGNPNPELTELLRRCNTVAAKHGQPGLYQWAEGCDGPGAGRQLGEAFHVSIAWSFAEPDDELERATRQVFGEPATERRLREVQVPVEGVKVKIGNVITHVELRQPGTSTGRKGAKNLLGL